MHHLPQPSPGRPLATAPTQKGPRTRGLAGIVWILVLAMLFLGTVHLGCENPATEPTPDASGKEPSEVSTTELATDAGRELQSEPLPETKPEPAIETAPLRDYPLDDTLKLNHIQVKGTHNSYHLDPGQGVDEWRYSHKPLDEQLGKLGVRQFEIDVYWNEELEAFLVYHIPILDQKTTCYKFTDCLKVIKKWSDVHRQHLPIFVFIEPKGLNKKTPKEAFAALEKEAQSVFSNDRMILPDDILGSHPNLKEAVAKDGWPSLAKVRGKVAFVLLMGGDYRAQYTNGDKDLKGRTMFVTADAGSPYAAVIKMDDPISQEEQIKKAVKAGALVRTRADTGLEQAKDNDRSRLEAALRSGAHFLSTDFPGPVDGVKYVVEIPGGTPARCNPIVAPPTCTPAALSLIGE